MYYIYHIYILYIILHIYIIYILYKVVIYSNIWYYIALYSLSTLVNKSAGCQLFPTEQFI